MEKSETDLIKVQVKEFSVNLRSLRKLVTNMMFRLNRMERALNLEEIGENDIEFDVSGSSRTLIAETIEILEELLRRIQDEGALE